jgi:hypothetical protein
MIKKYGLWYAVKYYWILQFLALALVFWLACPFLTNAFMKAMKISHGSVFYWPYKILVPVALIVAWFLTVIFITRSARYRYLTAGRSFLKDIGKYKRTYRELVEYFSDADPYKMD